MHKQKFLASKERFQEFYVDYGACWSFQFLLLILLAVFKYR